MENEKYQTPAKFRLIRAILRPVFRGLFHLLSRVLITGKENIPTIGAYLITINHISLFEPPLILAFWPTAPEAVGAVDIWDRKGQSALARLYGGIPVHRGQYDRQMIEKVIQVLRSGRPLLIAPEGGRSHSLGMRRALPGVAYLADQAAVPIVPVGIVGTSDDFLHKALRWQRPTVEIRIGKPFLLPAIQGKGENRRLERQQNSDLIMEKIAELLPSDYHGVYNRDRELIKTAESGPGLVEG